MTDVLITVQGSFEAFRRPERATLRLQVGSEGAVKHDVYDRTATVADSVSQQVRGLLDPDRGPVTWWSSSQLRTWANRPWNNEGKQLPLVYHATVDVQAKFSQFAVLNTFADEMGVTAGVSVSDIEWALTEAHRLELIREVRQRAVQDARARAQTYSDALTLGDVRVVEIADVGMLSTRVSRSGGGPEAAMFARAGAAPKSAPELNLVPEDVSVSVTVDARFACT